jgi:hypothetical protein
MIHKNTRWHLFLTVPWLVCTSSLQAQEALPPATLNVVYTTMMGPNSTLKEVPREVRLIRRESTQKNIGQQVALNVLLFAVGGGLGAQGFSKDELNGIDVPDVQDRAYLKNPVAEEYVVTLKSAINEKLADNSSYKGKTFKQPVMVQGGRASLIYESLAGEPINYFLKLDLLVAKRKESAGMLTFNPVVYVDCSGRSEQSMVLENWAQENYKSVSVELKKMLDSCQSKVVANIDNLLAQ